MGLWKKYQNPLFKVFTDCQLLGKHCSKTQVERGNEGILTVKEMRNMWEILYNLAHTKVHLLL
jgi:hypothetical protein